MDDFSYRHGALWCEGVPLNTLAERFGTPTYVYSASTLVDHFQRFGKAFEPIRPLREAVRRDVRSINIESEAEAELLARIAEEEGRRPRVAIRVNPDVAPDLRTPERTTTGTRGGKFGVDIERVAALFQCYADHEFVRMDGFHVHLGSPIFDPQSYALALDRLMPVVHELNAAGHRVSSINIGGGYPAEYEAHSAPSWDDFAEVIVPRLQDFVRNGGEVIMEPGRTIAANTGILLTSVRYLKQAGDKRVVVVDAGMTHLLRAAMYDSYHFIWPVEVGDTPPALRTRATTEGLTEYDVVGPICESSDYLAKGRALPELAAGSQVAVFTARAYGMTMTSNYNSQPRPAEVLVHGDEVRLIRRRETYDDLVALELFDQDPAQGR